MEVGATGATLGLPGAINAASERAARIAKLDKDGQFTKDMAQLPSDPKNVGVQGKVLKTKDSMLGDLLDIMA